MEALAVSLVFVLGLDVEAVLPPQTACLENLWAADNDAAEWKRLHLIAGSYALAQRRREAELQLRFWTFATGFRQRVYGGPGDDGDWLRYRMYAAGELRRMMGWTE